jgi:hypothetical protein
MKDILKVEDNIIIIRLDDHILEKLKENGDLGHRTRQGDHILIIRYKPKWED